MPKVTFPKIGEKHNFTPLITAKLIAAGMQRIPKKVIFIYSTTFERKLKASLSLSKCEGTVGKIMSFRARNLITPDKKLLIVSLPMGAPFTASALEVAIACGGKEFLILGTAGCLKKELQVADMVICTRAIRDEGTSHHYIRNSKYVLPDKDLTSNLERGMAKNKIGFHKGTTWTIDALFAETREEVKHYRTEGVLTVEMEAAALFAVAKKRKVKAAAIFTVSDILSEDWSGFEKFHKSDGYSKLIEVVKIFRNS
jgi:uridine phosphorylase